MIMSYIKKQLANLAYFGLKLASYFPTPLPVGLEEFNTWADSIIALAGQYADRDSMRFVLATLIVHSSTPQGSMSKNYFVQCLRKGAAKQVASYVFQEVKQKQAEVEAKKQQEATKENASDGQAS